MKESIAAMSNEIFEWSERLLFFKLEYNNSKHAVTGFSPSELFFGRKLNVPDALYTDPQTVDDYAIYYEKLQTHLQECKQMIKKNENEYFMQHAKYIKGRSKPKFEINEIVYLKNFNNTGVLQKKYIGPYKILRKLRNDNYVIEKDNEENTRPIKIHVSKIFLQEPLS